MKSLIVMLVLAAVLLAGCGSNQAVTEPAGTETTAAKSEEAATEKTAAEGTASVAADRSAQREREALRDAAAERASEERAERGACLGRYYASLPPERRGAESRRVRAEAEARGVTPFEVVGC